MQRTGKHIPPPKEISNAEKNRGLPWIIIGVIGFAFYATFSASSVFILFLDHMGMSKLQIGSLLAISPFLGLLALFVAPSVARIGYKRSTILSLFARNTVPALLFFTPWVLSRFGFNGLLVFVTVLLMFQAITNTIAQTAWFPWEQEYVPAAIRGKFFATTSMINNLLMLLALGAAGLLLGTNPETDNFTLLFLLGAGSGMFATWAFSRVPGGAPEYKPGLGKEYFSNLISVFKDKNFTLFLGGIGLIFFATSQFSAFIPLYMQDQVGLDSGKVVLLSSGATVGSMLSAYLWGWLIDRYGSHPVMVANIFLFCMLPIFWFIMPHHSAWSFVSAFAIAMLNGSIAIGWNLGYVRQLYASVPIERKSEYMAVFYACFGLLSGFSQFAGGWLLDIFEGIGGKLWIFSLNPFSVLFLLGVVIPPFAFLMLRRMQSDSQINAAQMAAMFVQGNPLMAFESILRYQFPGNEPAALKSTERMGLTGSPLTVRELSSSLDDPRFNVRLEAVLAIARRQPDPHLTDALVRMLNGSDPALGTIAAWALSRSGDTAAIPTLRSALQSPYRSVQAHSVRALGTLGDQDATHILLDKLSSESDPGLQTACAASLGNLRCMQAVPDLLRLLHDLPEASQRMEIVLALVRILGEEQSFIRLHRQVRKDRAGALAEAVSALEKLPGGLTGWQEDLRACAEKFSTAEIEPACQAFAQILLSAIPQNTNLEHHTVLKTCAEILEEYGSDRLEVLLLALNLLKKT